LITVAAMLPADWQKKLVDMNVSALKDRDLEWADMVFISAMVVQKEAVRQVISQCKAAGKKIVAGGPLFSAGYEDFKEVDHFVLGEAEEILPQFLADLAQGCAHAVYRAAKGSSLSATPVPLWNLLAMKKYVSMNIQYSRGCPFDCEFCDITVLFGKSVRTKSKDQILSELEQLYVLGWRGHVFFVDDNFIGNKQKLKTEVLPAIIAWMKKHKYPFTLSTETSINLADDEELMELMVQARFDEVFVGIETPNEESLAECSKFQNKNRDLVACVQKIQMAGLKVQGGFIVGFDNDSPSVFAKQIELIQKSRIITAMVGLLNAPRGTRLYQRIVKEGRLREDISGDNTDFSINFSPKMGHETLIEGYRKIIQGIYAPKPYFERVKAFLRDYRPRRKKTLRLRWGHIRFHFGYSLVLFKSVLLLGMKDRARIHFWKLFFWSLFRRPKIFNLAITYAIYGYHFRKVFESHL
jgi:radical SAM superfamily enzyme YgiQ (UPF0313 family)